MQAHEQLLATFNFSRKPFEREGWKRRGAPCSRNRCTRACKMHSNKMEPRKIAGAQMIMPVGQKNRSPKKIKKRTTHLPNSRRKVWECNNYFRHLCRYLLHDICIFTIIPSLFLKKRLTSLEMAPIAQRRP